jgi:hypothetical protein
LPQDRVKRSDFLTEDFEVAVVQISRHHEEDEEQELEQEQEQEQEEEQEAALPQDPEAKMRKINELLNMIESQVICR